MYERFTDRSRKVMQLAQSEAQRFNHEYIGTEHLLLGLIKEGSGVASHVLQNLDVDLRKVRLEVEKIVQSGPDMVTVGKLPQTPRTKKVLEYAIDEAKSMGHNYVGTEHLLLGLIREQEGVAFTVLKNLDVNYDEVREEVFHLVGQKTKVEIQRTKSPEAKTRSVFSKTNDQKTFHEIVDVLFAFLRQKTDLTTLFNSLDLALAKRKVAAAMECNPSGTPSESCSGRE